MTQILEQTNTPAVLSEACPDAVEVSPVVDRDEGNVFELLADQARDRNASGLWMTAFGGAANAALVWSHYGSLHWLAAGFAAVASYGIWGLADRAVARRLARPGRIDIRRDALSAVRTVAIPVGLIAAIGAVGGFMAAALGGWQH